MAHGRSLRSFSLPPGTKCGFLYCIWYILYPAMRYWFHYVEDWDLLYRFWRDGFFVVGSDRIWNSNKNIRYYCIQKTVSQKRAPGPDLTGFSPTVIFSRSPIYAW